MRNFFTIILALFILRMDYPAYCEENTRDSTGVPVSSSNTPVRNLPPFDIADKKDGFIDVLKFKNVEIGDVLNYISQKTALNIISGQNVAGTVTIYLKNVDVKDVLRVILEANSLAYAQEGNIIKVSKYSVKTSATK